MRFAFFVVALLCAPIATLAQSDDCYPGLGLCEDAVTAQTPLPSRINIGTPDGPVGEAPANNQPAQDSQTTQSGQTTQGSQTTQSDQSAQVPARPANPVCVVYDVRPPDAWLALRTEPSSKRGTRLYKLPSGTAIEMLGPREGNWHLVRVPDGTVGWVSWYRDRWIAC